MLSRVAPRLGLPTGLTGKDLTNDAARAADYDRDPLVFKNATARWFTETKRAQESAIARAAELRLPLYETFGQCDRVASSAMGRAFFARVASTDKTWSERKGAFHEVLSEADWRETASSVADWVIARASS